MSNLNLILPIGAFLALLLLVPAAAGDQIDAFWTNAYGGNWAAGANWSTAPDYPNNGGAQTYNAIIDLVGAAYTITLDSPSTVVDNFTLNSSSATLKHVSGVFQVLGTADLLAGTYQLSGGTLQGGISNVAP
ncbi:MAG TPA: hypothetical protein PLQ87_11110, partial [Phycisphaerae bacterium]|nr:hypothetical protein [Phycisphaerae bacterium]